MTASVADIDALARRLMIQLVDETPLAPPFESIHHDDAGGGFVPRPGPPGRVRPLLAAVASVAIVAGGLGLVTYLRSAEPAATASPTAQQLPSVVPDGWVLDRVLGPGSFVETGLRPQITLYATSASPLGPIVAVVQYGSGPTSTSANIVETETADGRRVVLSDTYIAGVRAIDIQATPSSWVTLNGRDVSDDTLIVLAETASVTADGFARLDTTALEQAGLTPVGEGTLWNLPFSGGRDWDPGSIPAGTTVSSYMSPDVDGHIDLNTYMATPFDRAALGLHLGPAQRPEDPQGWFRVDTGMDTTTGWFVERDGYTHVVLGPTEATAAMRTILETLTPVDDATWVERAKALGSPTADETSAATTIAVDTTARSAAPAGPERQELSTRTELQDDGSRLLTISDTSGSATQLRVAFIGRRLIVTPQDPALAEFPVERDIGNLMGLSSAVNFTPAGSLIVLTAPSTTSADHAEITSGGTTYVVELIQIDDTYPIVIAVLLVGPDEDSNPQIVLTGNGQVVETL
jgi:hypothetical protein